VLFGDVEPGGRLPQTFPKALIDNSAIKGDPAVYPGKDGHVRYAEGVFVGYRHHDTHAVEPLFPFGFGLGYTRFSWCAPRLSAAEMGAEGVTVSLDLINTGDRAGSELVQLYVRSPKTKVKRPDKELRAFAKLSLQPGETGTATMKILPRDLAYFDVEAGAFRAEPGDYQLIVAANAADIRFVVELSSPSSYVLLPSH